MKMNAKQKNNSKPVLLLSYNNADAENILMDAVNKSERVETRCTLKSHGILLRGIRRFMLDRGMPGAEIWLGDWRKRIHEYEVIVLTAARYTPGILHWIHKKNPQVRLINYYWDKVEISGYPIKESKEFENWSFDREDCKRYGFQYNPQYYSKHLSLPRGNEKYDVSFVGADREGTWPERADVVNKTYKLLKEHGFYTFFYFVTDNSKVEKEIIHKNRLSEKEFLKVTGSSKAVVDLVQPGKEWMTLRPFLALANGRKLITNYTGIQQYGFYDRNNIFILGMDTMERLKEFMETPFSVGKDGELKKYEVDVWAERFLEYGCKE